MSIPFASTYTVRTYTQSTALGKVSQSLTASTTVQATVTPADDRTLKALPEGLRASAMFRVRTQTDLGDLGDRGDTTDRRIVVGGREYQLRNFGNWTPVNFGSLAHRKYVALEVTT